MTPPLGMAVGRGWGGAPPSIAAAQQPKRMLALKFNTFPLPSRSLVHVGLATPVAFHPRVSTVTPRCATPPRLSSTMLAARVRAASSRATAAVSRVMQARSVAPAVVVPAATALACLFPAGPISAGHARLAHATAGTDAAAEAAKGEEEDDTTQQASPEDASEGAPAAEVDVAELQKELQELRNTRVRLLAEMENTREIARRDVEKGKTYAIQKFAKELLDVSDNLERAVSAVTPEQMEERDDPLLKNLHFGVLATEKELLKLFENHGITKVRAPESGACAPTIAFASPPRHTVRQGRGTL